MSPRAEAMLGPLFASLADLDVAASGLVYADDAIDEVRSELLGLDGVLVWVNPIQDGANRALLDSLLRQASAEGVFVSAHPDVIDAMGTKEVLFTTQRVGWGGDVGIYRSPEEMVRTFPARLGRFGRLVVKQARGTGGNGVWRVELPAGRTTAAPSPDTTVLVQRSEPRNVTPLEEQSLGGFVADCRAYFAWSGSMVDQPYQDRLDEGMIRVYLVHDEVVGICHQWPKGLLSPTTIDKTTEQVAVSTMEDPDAPAYASLRAKAESEWVPAMSDLLAISRHELPVIWDADFLYGPKTDLGEDSYVLCEVNVQAVWPYPTQASDRLAAAALRQVLAAKSRRQGRSAASECSRGELRGA